MDDKPSWGSTIRFWVGAALSLPSYFLAIALPVYALLVIFSMGLSSETTPILLYLAVVELLLWVLGRVGTNISVGNKLFEGVLPFSSKKKS